MANTTKIVDKQAQNNAKRKIPIRLPLLPDEGGAGITNQNIPVTINGVTTIIPRGEHVEVSPEIYRALYDTGRFQM